MPPVLIVALWVGFNLAVLLVLARFGLISIRPRTWTSADDACLARWARSRAQATGD